MKIDLEKSKGTTSSRFLHEWEVFGVGRHIDGAPVLPVAVYKFFHFLGVSSSGGFMHYGQEITSNHAKVHAVTNVCATMEGQRFCMT